MHTGAALFILLSQVRLRARRLVFAAPLPSYSINETEFRTSRREVQLRLLRNTAGSQSGDSDQLTHPSAIIPGILGGSPQSLHAYDEIGQVTNRDQLPSIFCNSNPDYFHFRYHSKIQTPRMRSLFPWSVLKRCNRLIRCLASSSMH